MKLLLLLGLALFVISKFRIIRGSKIRVQDGDSVIISGRRCRLLGFDAPEWDQTYGSAATRALRHFINGHMIVMFCGVDVWGRHLVCMIGRRGPVGVRMLAGGHAHPEGYLGDLVSLWARITRRGLWNGPSLHPSLWREQDAPYRRPRLSSWRPSRLTKR